ncbi:MAG: hypothetical protein J7K89_09850 [Candidatus Cloacimonetes bacterium]|nr:hypothetical protein [Candidatus Cloacimonadota bacterium]
MLYGLAGVMAILLWSLALFSTRTLLDSGFGTNIITVLRYGLAAIITHFLMPRATRQTYIRPKDKPCFLPLLLK